MPKKNFLLPLAGLFILALSLRILPGPRIIDDAFISFRYARNILSGNGFVFNIGERVLGTTTPLYTLLLAFLGMLFGGAKANFPFIALGLNAFFDAISVVLLVMIGRHLKSKWTAWGAALAWAIAPFSVTFAIGGLETSFYIFLLIGIYYTYLNKNYRLAAFLSALSVLTRPDALLLIIPLGIHRFTLFRLRKAPAISKEEWIALFGPLSIWVIFASLYFSSPIPQSLIAKSEAYLLDGSTAFVRLLQHFATPFQGQLSFGLNWIKLGLLIFPFLAIVGSRLAMRNNENSFVFILFPWIYLIAFSLANPLIFRWYLSPPLPFYFLFILLGLENVLTKIAEKYLPVNRFFKALFFIILVFGPALLLKSDWQAIPHHGPEKTAPEMAWIELELQYLESAKLIMADKDWTASKIIAAGDVGVLGYVSDAPILDLVGLISPQSVIYFPLAISAYTDFIYAIPTQVILDQKPDYIAILEIYGRHTLLKQASFFEDYQIIAEIQSNVYGSKNMLIFKRLPGPH